MIEVDISDIEKEFLKLTECRRSFYAYVKHVILSRPGHVDGKHIGIMCKKAQEMSEGRLKDLTISMPPRHMKSTLWSEAFPVWYICNNPNKEIIIASHTQDQARKMMKSILSIFSDPQHRRIFPEVELDIVSADEIRLKGKVGGRPNIIGVGVASGLTGSGGDIMILDDAVKDMIDATSPTMRARTKDWYTSVFLTRRSPDAAVVRIGTRWHEDDILGWVMSSEKDGERLIFPAISEGKALWPERFSLERLDEIKQEVGDVIFETMYQCNPTPPRGVYVFEEGIDFEVVRREDWPNHITERTPQGIGIDFGWNTHATVAGWVQPEGIYVRQMQYIHKTKLATILEELSRTFDIKGWEKRIRVQCDSAEPGSIMEVKSAGFPLAAPAPKNEVGVFLGIQQSRERKLFLHEDDVDLVFEFRNYRWDPKVMQADKDYVPVKGRDHGVDATRYMLMYIPKDRNEKIITVHPKTLTDGRRI